MPKASPIPPLPTSLQPFEAELAALARLLDVGGGSFSLSVAKCNSPALRREIIDWLSAEREGITTLDLPRGVENVLSHAREMIQDSPAALFITGLEHSLSSDDSSHPLLRSLNASRELWAQAFTCPIVFWVPEFAERLLCDKARDLWRWMSHYFDFPDGRPEAVALAQTQIMDYSDALNLSVDLKHTRIVELENRLLEIAEQDDPSDNFLRSAWLGELGVLHYSRGDLEEAEASWKKALEIDEALGRKVGMAINYGNLGNVYQTRGDLEEAEAFHKKALAIDEALGLKEGMAAHYGNLGNLYASRADLEQAEVSWKKSLEISEALGSKEGMASQYGNLGNLYATRGDLEQAEASYRKALAINEVLGRKVGMAINYGNLGIVFAKRGELDQAEGHLGKALEINKELGLKEGMSRDYKNLGNVYLRRGELDKAKEYYGKSLEIETALGRKEGMGIGYGNLGIVAEERRESEKARDYWQRARDLYKKLGNQPQVEKYQGWIDGLPPAE